MPVSDECRTDVTDYKQKYRNLKRKLKFLIYENECFQEELRKAQRKLLKVTRDKSFLLDRLLQYEQVGDSTSDSDATVSSDSEADAPMPKKKRATAPANPSAGMNAGIPGTVASSSGVGPRMVGRQHGSESSKRKKPTTKILKQAPKVTAQVDTLPMVHGDGHMTSEEIERHLESRQTLLDLLPEKAPPTVPTEMFSNEPSSLDSEAHEGGDDTSPSNIGDGFPEDDSLVIDLAEQGCL